MLHFVLGTTGVSKTKYLYDKMCSLVKDNNEKLMFIVPDQASFETEKAAPLRAFAISSLETFCTFAPIIFYSLL